MEKVKVKMKYNLVEDAKEIKNVDLRFHDVHRLNDKEYSLVLSAYQIAELWYSDENLLSYFVPTQRGVKHSRTTKGNSKVTPIISNSNVKEMVELITNDKFYTSQLTFNVLDEGEKCLEYKNGTLRITKGLNILDGMHRITSIYKVYLHSLILGEDSDLTQKLKNLMFPVKITHYDLNSAQIMFSQYSKGLKLSTSKVESFDMSKASNRIVDKLNKHSVLKGMIDVNKTSIAKTDITHIVTFATLNEAVKNSFGVIQNEKEEREIYEFLELFFYELMLLFPEMQEAGSRVDSKEYSLLCENMMFYGYLTIAEILYLKRFKDWKTELYNLDKIPFEKDNEIWQPIVRVNNDRISLVNNKNTRNILCKIIKEQFYKFQ